MYLIVTVHLQSFSKQKAVEYLEEETFFSNSHKVVMLDSGWVDPSHPSP